MRYMVLTTRHHDGFCLFETKTTDFSAPNSAAKRDLIAEYADACHEAGMPCGFYYSLEDWRFPHQLPHLPMHEDMSVYEPMVAQAHAQVRELLTNYGKIDILWYDGGFPAGVWRSEELNAMARELQPHIIINNRSDEDGDFGTPEQSIHPESRPWEACMTMCDTWGYTVGDNNYKTTKQILSLLLTCAANGGNLLLNVGPNAEGRIPKPAVERLREIGRWMNANGEAIYGAGPAPLVGYNLGPSTRVGDRLYLHVKYWPGPTLTLGWVGNTVRSARLLATGHEARVVQDGDRVRLHDLPQYPPDPLCTVVELEVEGEPRYPDVRYT